MNKIDLNILYQLSLSIGLSMNLKNNCIQFLTPLMSMKNFDFSCVYIKDNNFVNGGYRLFYASRADSKTDNIIPASHPICKILGEKNSISVDNNYLDFNSISTEYPKKNGIVILFNLKNVGILKLTSLTKNKEEAESDRLDLHDLIIRFNESLKNCLNYEKMEIELASSTKFLEENPNPLLRFSSSTKILLFNNIAGAEIIQFFDHNGSLKTQFLNSVKHIYEIGEPKNIKLKIGSTIFLCNVVPLKSESYVNIYISDISAIVKANKALKASEEKYRSIIENMKLGIVEVNTDDIITKVYPEYCLLSGYSEIELLGKPYTKTLLSESSQQVMKAQNKKREEGQAGVYEVQIKQKNGELKWVLISGAPLYDDDDDNIVGSIGIHLDISSSKKMQDDLIIAKEKAEESTKVKTQFMADMSHEIRTPMNAIIGMSELLSDTTLLKKQKTYLSAIHTSANNLLTIINNILDFSKIEAGKESLEKIDFNLNNIVENCLDIVKFKADENGVKVLYELDPKITPNLVGDPNKLTQVLINLLTNAVKFSTNSQVLISLELENENPRQNQIKFSIKDNGIGIEPKFLKHIFDSFSQAEHSTARKYGGTGLGLPISKKLIEMMGGEIKIESEINKGSIFYFSILLEKGKKIIIPSTPVNDVAKDLKQVKILLVEDNPINRLVAITLLEKWNCHVDYAEDGLQALEKLKINYYDLVLMDMRMPNMDGIEATIQTRKHLKLNLPIIALTANAIKGDAELCLDAGMNDYISKPFKPDELFNTIKKHLFIDE